MNKLPKILFLTAGKLSVGGVENHLLTLAGGLKDHFLFSLMGNLGEPFKSQWEKLGQQAYYFSARGSFGIKAIIEIRRVIMQVKPDVLHIHDSRAGLLARLANIGCGVPVVYSMHYPSYQYVDVSAFRRLIYGQIERVLNWLLTDWTIFLFKNVYQDAVRRLITPRKQAKVIRTGIDVGLYQRSAQKTPKKAATGEEPIKLLLVSRITHQKRVELAIQAAALLIEKGYPIVLSIAGDGPERDMQQEEAARLGIIANVEFLGFRSDVPELLEKADIFLLTSRYEGGPYVVMEAMAAGKPCVATAVGDVPWFLADGAGVVVETPDPELFAAEISKLLDNDAVRLEMGIRARKKAEAEFSLERMMVGYADLYDEIIRGER